MSLVCRMLYVVCCMPHAAAGVVRCLLSVACRMLSVVCCMPHVVRCLLHAACCTLSVACRMLYVVCCMLHAVLVCFGVRDTQLMFHVAAAGCLLCGMVGVSRVLWRVAPTHFRFALPACRHANCIRMLLQMHQQRRVCTCARSDTVAAFRIVRALLCGSRALLSCLH